MLNTKVMEEKRIQSYSEFWSFYLSQHQNRVCQVLHVFGTLGALVLLATVVSLQFWWGLLAVPVFGYGFAWIGHFVFEKNRPATFQYPFWSLISDFKMVYWFFSSSKKR